jgi:hypothetical protein
VKFSLGGDKGLAIFATNFPSQDRGLVGAADEIEQPVTVRTNSLRYDQVSGQ